MTNDNTPWSPDDAIRKLADSVAAHEANQAMAHPWVPDEVHVRVREIVVHALLKEQATDEADDAETWQEIAMREITELFDIDVPRIVRKLAGPN